MPFINRSPLNYKVNTQNAIRIFEYPRAPTNADYKQFQVGDEWWDTALFNFWKMVYRDSTQGVWRMFAPAGVAATLLTPDVGGQVAPDGLNNINLLGAGGLQTVGNPPANTVTIQPAGGGNIVETLTGDLGGAVGPDGTATINVLGGAGITTTGNPAANTLTIALTGGGTAIDTVTPDSGGAVAPDAAGNINFLGDSVGYLYGMHFYGDGANNTVSAMDLRNITIYVVDAVAGQTEYQTVQAAVTAANAAGGGVVWVRPGTYVEDLVLYNGVDLIGAVATPAGDPTTITGTHTPPNTGSVSFRNLSLTDATNILNSNAAGTTTIAFVDCLFTITNGLSINLPNWQGLIAVINCHCLGTQDGFIDIGAGAANFLCTNSTIGVGDNLTSALGGLNRIENCKWQCKQDWVGQAYGLIRDSEINNTWFVSNGSVGTCESSYFYMDAIDAINNTSTGQIDLYDVTIDSSNNPCIVGTGPISYGNVKFINNTAIAGTTTLVAPEWMITGPQNIISHDATAVAEDAWTKYEIQGSQAYSWGIDNTDDFMKMTDGADPSSGNTMWVMTTAGERTMPLQPAFLAYNSVGDANQTGNGALVTIEFNTEVFDQNSDYNNTTDTFTAPVTGKYTFETSVFVDNVTAAMTASALYLVTSNRSYETGVLNPGAARNFLNQITLNLSVLADMDAADTAYVQCVLYNGAGNTAGFSGHATVVYTYFSGELTV